MQARNRQPKKLLPLQKRKDQPSLTLKRIRIQLLKRTCSSATAERKPFKLMMKMTFLILMEVMRTYLGHLSRSTRVIKELLSKKLFNVSLFQENWMMIGIKQLNKNCLVKTMCS